MAASSARCGRYNVSTSAPAHSVRTLVGLGKPIKLRSRREPSRWRSSGRSVTGCAPVFSARRRARRRRHRRSPLRPFDGSHGHRRGGDLGRPQPEPVFRAVDAQGKTDGCSCSGPARRDQRCQMFRGRKMVAPAPARHASPQVPKLTAQAASCDVPPNWSSVTPNRSVPRKLAPKPMQE